MILANDISKNSFCQPDPLIKTWFELVGNFPGTIVDGKKLEFSKNVATGYAIVDVIEPGLSYRIVNYKINKDFELTSSASDKFNLNIYFYQFFSNDKVFFQMGKNVIETDGNSYRAIVLTNTAVFQKLAIKKGTEVKGVTIEISEEWIMRNICSAKSVSLLRENDFLLKVLTAKPRKILDEIFSDHSHLQIPQLFIKSRMLRLLDQFLQNILKANSIESFVSISPKDFESILTVEKILLENYNGAFPKIEKLARIALMSESKLKKIYKQSFGMGLYEYYQKNRMHKAKEMLNTGEYSVSEVGAMLGYSNLSNFSTSFKKEFNQLPKNSLQLK